MGKPHIELNMVYIYGKTAYIAQHGVHIWENRHIAQHGEHIWENSL